MLSPDNFTKERIQKLQAESKTDPEIIERTLFAFGLLEAIRRVGMPFIFKGGSALLLLLKKPMRLSTDIDIIVKPGTDVDHYIEEAGRIFPFINVKPDIRKGFSNIEKRHYKFTYQSPNHEKPLTILLDILFEENPYEALTERPIRNDLLLTEGDDLSVSLPDTDCILGDKLTAFAPHTTGIPFGIDKELEIAKQMFDCATLFDEMNDYGKVVRTYNCVLSNEMAYRNLHISIADVLHDTINSCICILGRGSIRNDEYSLFSDGITGLGGHIFTGTLSGENAGLLCCKILYLCTCMLTGKTECTKIMPNEIVTEPLKINKAKRISYMRMTYPEEYTYLYRAFEMLPDWDYLG